MFSYEKLLDGVAAVGSASVGEWSALGILMAVMVVLGLALFRHAHTGIRLFVFLITIIVPLGAGAYLIGYNSVINELDHSFWDCVHADGSPCTPGSTRQAQIIVQIELTNERGTPATGLVVNRRTISAAWPGGFNAQATISDDLKSIDWHNGTYWKRP